MATQLLEKAGIQDTLFGENRVSPSGDSEPDIACYCTCSCLTTGKVADSGNNRADAAVDAPMF